MVLRTLTHFHISRRCAPAWEDPANLWYNWYLIGLGFFLPVSLILYTSGSVLYFLKRVRKR